LSVADFGAKTGWSREKVRVFLAYLRKHGMIKLYSDHSSTFVLIVNYDKWQGTEDNQANNQESNQVDSQADATTDQRLEDEDNQADNIAHNTANNTPSEESPPCILLKKEGRRSSTKEPPTPKNDKVYKIPHLTFNPETLTIDGFDDKARAYATKLFPNKDLDKAFHSLLEWIVKKDRHYQNYWKSYITFCSGMPEEVLTRFNEGALKGQIYRVNHGVSQVQQNKRPEPVTNLKKLGIKESE
jgi:hypothetical protein